MRIINFTKWAWMLMIGLFFIQNMNGQSRIDASYAFQSDPAKKYSLYIPSSYNPATPNKVMLGLHPLNTNRWDAEAWCDTLIVFAETNNLILVCPDGGLDGKIDDAIDTAFTSNLLDSVEIWYNIDPNKAYVMGFSWGGKTTYTYGLSHAWRFRGFLPIGSAMSGTSEVTGSIANASGKPFYLVHGSFDTPSSRYTPILNALNTNGALVNSLLMTGVGHTIDFPNRNQILTTAFEWIDSVNCSTVLAIETPVLENNLALQLYPNPVLKDQSLTLEYNSKSAEEVTIRVFNLLGNQVLLQTQNNVIGQHQVRLPLTDLIKGSYFLQIETGLQKQTQLFVIY